MKRNRLLPVAVCCLALLAASCSTDEDDGTTLPDGKYPMTFAAQVDGMAATRATTDNTWAGSEEVAVQIGSEVKKYTAATNGTLTVAGGDTPWYWQNTTETKTVNAWYPYSDKKPAADELKVKADQSGNGYGLSDHLEAAAATVTFRSPALTFKHRTAKVVVTLKAGNGVSAGDVSSATVRFVNQAGVEGDNVTEVTPKTETTNGIITHTALVIPKQMKDNKFIKVTVGGNDYFYTPTGQNDANLTGGNQYTYDITVNKSGLTVTADGATGWNSSGPATDVTGKELASGYSASDLKIGDYYYSDGTWSDGGYRKDAHGTTDILPVMPVLTDADGNPRTVIGIVMKVGRDGSGTWADTDTYTDKAGNAMSTIRGYVLALKDGNGGSTCTWGSYDYVVGTNKEQKTLFCGYSNTQKIKDYAKNNNKNLSSDFPAAYHASDGYETREDSKYASPTNSSGWFFPSAGQCWYWYQNREVLKTSMDKAGGERWQNYYWSSSEFSLNSAKYVWYVNFSDGSVSNVYKNNYNYLRVRSVLAF